MSRRKQPVIPDELLDQLLGGTDPQAHGDSVLGHGYAHAVSGSWQPILRCVCRVQLWAIGSLRSGLETAPTAATAGRGERTTLFRLDVVSLANTGRTWI